MLWTAAVHSSSSSPTSVTAAVPQRYWWLSRRWQRNAQRRRQCQYRAAQSTIIRREAIPMTPGMPACVPAWRISSRDQTAPLCSSGLRRARRTAIASCANGRPKPNITSRSKPIFDDTPEQQKLPSPESNASTAKPLPAPTSWWSIRSMSQRYRQCLGRLAARTDAATGKSDNLLPSDHGGAAICFSNPQPASSASKPTWNWCGRLAQTATASSSPSAG